MLQLYGGGVTQEPAPTLQQLDEETLLAAFVPLLPQAGASVPSGDDAAVVPLTDARLVVTTDVLVEGRHFRLDWSAAEDIGWRAIMQNASDVASMGAAPVACVVALVLPAQTHVDWVVGLARGMAAACAAVQQATGRPCGVVGGDLSSGDSVVIAVAAHGDLAGADPLLRSGARPGDILAHAGTLGRSAAGLAALQAGRAADPDLAGVITSYRRPLPALAEALAARGRAHAMMDVSDGLLRDAGRMARASGVRLEILTPQPDAAVAQAARRLGADPVPWVLGGGEDHGMLAAFPPGAVPAGFTVIGRVADGSGVLVDGRTSALAPGWDHFGHPTA